MSYESVSMRKIKEYCKLFRLEQDVVFDRAKCLIDNYHGVIWANAHDGSIESEACDKTFNKDLALSYIADFNPSEEKGLIRDKMLKLFEPKWLMDLVATAMRQVKSFSVNSSDYNDILNNYMSDAPVTDRVLCSTINVGKTTLGTRKREAILLFGIALWGIVIQPKTEVKRLMVAETYEPKAMGQ